MSLVAFLFGCGAAQKRSSLAQAPAPAPAIQPLPLKPPIVLATGPPAPSSDAVDDLISQVEELYNTGVANYRSGNLEGAKDLFDRAVEKLLESNLNIQGDDRLSAEFDKLVENVYAVETAALERGDSLSPHNYVPSPLESFSGLTFPVDPRIKQRVQQEIKAVQSDLPLVSNDYVDGVLTYFQNRARGYITIVLRRLGVYQPIISEALRKEGVPQDLIYLAAGESAFNPYAVSRTGAKGIWQFMPGTGLLYGLKKDRWVDDREDPTKSTQAAAHHLKDLYQTFGDWFLAMAAYDSGPLTVQRAIERTGYADFWSLRRLHALPTETENYVPIFLAIALIAKDPKAYGFDVQPDPPLAADPVAVTVPTDLRLAAQLVDRPVEELIRLNPSLLRWTTPPSGSPFTLMLPQGTKDLFEQRIAAIPEDKRIWWRAYKVEEGETVSSIAKKLRVSPVALRQANRLNDDSTLEQGARLVVPLAPGSESSLARVHEKTGPRHVVQYRVRAGDTLDLIADRFDVTPYEIRHWNGLRTSRLTAGKPLRIFAAGGNRSVSGKSHGKRRKSTGMIARRTGPSKAPRRGREAATTTKHAQPVAGGR